MSRLLFDNDKREELEAQLAELGDEAIRLLRFIEKNEREVETAGLIYYLSTLFNKGYLPSFSPSSSLTFLFERMKSKEEVRVVRDELCSYIDEIEEEIVEQDVSEWARKEWRKIDKK